MEKCCVVSNLDISELFEREHLNDPSSHDNGRNSFHGKCRHPKYNPSLQLLPENRSPSLSFWHRGGFSPRLHLSPSFKSSSHPSDFFSWTLSMLQNCYKKQTNKNPIWVSLTDLSCCPPTDRRSGTDWLVTLSLIRRMAWGETLIWTSSAWKKTAVPGWAHRTGTANYTTLKLPPRLLKFIPFSACMCARARVRESQDVGASALVCVCVREDAFTGSLFPVIHEHARLAALDINNFVR